MCFTRDHTRSQLEQEEDQRVKLADSRIKGASNITDLPHSSSNSQMSKPPKSKQFLFFMPHATCACWCSSRVTGKLHKNYTHSTLSRPCKPRIVESESKRRLRRAACQLRNFLRNLKTWWPRGLVKAPALEKSMTGLETGVHQKRDGAPQGQRGNGQIRPCFLFVGNITDTDLSHSY
jgi:hypothetical protein